MIFITVGTHEQQFDRIMREVDALINDERIKERVIIQGGYSTYHPKKCEWHDFLPYDKMKEMVQSARIVITHGGPASFMMPIQMGKIPIVVPRQKKFGEHINDHQLIFTRKMYEEYQSFLLVEDVQELGSVIDNFDNLQKDAHLQEASNTEAFNEKFKKVMEDLMS